MRTSILSRSVIAVASLAIGPVALAATPATAAPPPGVTRDQVLTAINSLRTVQTENEYYTVVEPQLFEIARASCDFSEEDDSVYFDTHLTASGQSADGILINTFIDNGREENLVRRHCAIAVLASTDPALALSGNLTFSGSTADDYPVGPSTALTPTSYALSGDVFVSPPITSLSPIYISSASFVANGHATGTVNVTTTKNVTFKKAKTKSGEKASKAKYDKRLKAAAKWYAKRIQKAGNSKSKKAAAKKAYAKKKAAYKKAYDKRYFGTKSESTTTARAESRPFNVTAGFGGSTPAV